ncbi:CNP1-like family protein [Denitromonas iodatirespirans]|uniref:CNP1-like uncharacterized domain-containing protein n=1 Tax=Denitromonas iodatirespirans TaxID=2795389 RepID=A0A944DD77_DENI1|nr:CNP1-like family protein [Denitromonas iodatirespirans]MBT0964070.1 hypothetical protein [Denitromonas iodatirespirans]
MHAKCYSCAVSVVVLTLLSACANNKGPVREWREPETTKWEEADTTPPTALPLDADLIEFDVQRRGQTAFFVDSAHIEIGSDGVTRLPLVSRSSRGAAVVTYEGFRCETSENRLYAIASEGQWSIPRTNPWRTVALNSFDPKSVLMHDFLCKDASPRAPDEIIQKLRYPKPDWQ